MKLFDGEALRRRILENYSRNPKGWSFTVSPSLKDGFFDAFVSGPEEAWMLKIDSIFKPSPAVLGAPTEPASIPRPSPFQYGYREFPPELIPRVFDSEDHQQRDRTVAGLLSILRSEPIVPEEGRAYAHGPIVFTSPSRSALLDGQRELDDKLASEMRRLLRAKYPAYG